MPPVSKTPDDDDRWRQRILAADPAHSALESADFASAVRRLEAAAQRSWTAASQGSDAEPQAAPKRSAPAQRPRGSRFSLLLAVAVALVLGSGLAVSRLWWIRSSVPPEVAAVPDPSAAHEVPAHEAPAAGKPPAAGKIDRSVAADAGPTVGDADAVAVVATGPRGTRKIQTVAELVKLPPSQLARVQRQLDRAALDQELQAWLRQWHDGSPDQRQALEQIWIGQRGFWAGWTVQGLRTWTDPTVLRAGVEVMSLELGSHAAPSLAFCWERAETRGLAAAFLVPLATDAQLAQWLPRATDRDQVFQVLAEVVRRPSDEATELLATLAVDPVCQSALKDPGLVWNSVHGQRALAALAAPQPHHQYRAAMLLTVIDGPDIDRDLVQKMLSGAQTLPAMAVWLLRHPGNSQHLAVQIQNSPHALAVVPSANQRAQKWSRQQRSESSGPSSFRKVCQLCVTAS